MNKINKFIVLVFIISHIFPANQAGKSLLIPGLGEKKLGYEEYSKKFFLTEVTIWLSFLFTNELRSSYQNTYKNYSILHADVNWSGKNDLYASRVGNYNSLEEYNNTSEWLYGTDTYSYPETDYYDWNWCGVENECDDDEIMKRRNYDSWRNKSREYEEIRDFTVAALLINRVISVFNVLRLERKNKITSEIFPYNEHSFDMKIFYHF